MVNPCAGNPAPAPPVAPATARGAWPGLNLDRWKLTLPIGSKHKPTEILNPTLKTFRDPRYFYVNGTNDGVVFSCPGNGVTTQNSSNPRSELREMLAGGKDEARWSTHRGTHTLTIQQAITAAPHAVVAGQIHDADDDVTVFRLEGSNLYSTKGDDSHAVLITSSYVLGTAFTAEFIATGGAITVKYNGSTVQTITGNRKGCYFKVGSYHQSGGSGSAAAEVVVYSINLVHS